MFFVISFEPSNPNIKFSLYKNGVLEDTQTKVMATGGQYNTSFKIGARTNGYPTASQNTFLNGFVDDFRVYNSVISNAIIKKMYIAGLDSIANSGNISDKEYSKRINELAEK